MNNYCPQYPYIRSNIIISVGTSEYSFIKILFWFMKPKFLKRNIKINLRVQNTQIPHFDNLKVMFSLEPNQNLTHFETSSVDLSLMN